MDSETIAGAGLKLPIPQRGLVEMLSSWSGKGQLWDALAAVQSDDERAWSWRDVERRARRILFAQLAPWIMHWPSSEQGWLDALPADSLRMRTEADNYGPGISWHETRKHGWPPKIFVMRQRHRIANTLLVTCLRWTLENLSAVWEDAVSLEPNLDKNCRAQLRAAMRLTEHEPVFSANPVQPSRIDLNSVMSEGAPWNRLVPVSDALRQLEVSTIEGLAHELVVPDDELRHRLFHLGVAGEFVHHIRTHLPKLISVRPLSGSTIGPAFHVRDGSSHEWDLWFEAAGIWSYYSSRSPYIVVTQSLRQVGRPIGADLLLICPNIGALVLECKYSADPGTVGRLGYAQISAYANELRSQLVPIVWAVVVAPEGIAKKPEFVETLVGRLGVIPPSAIAALVTEFLDQDGIMSNSNAGG